MKFRRWIAWLVSLMLILSFSFPASAGSEQVTFRPFEGDADMDTVLNTSDALVILQYCVKLRDFSETQKLGADMNQDQTIDVKDSLLVLQAVVGLRYPLREAQPEQGDKAVAAAAVFTFPAQPTPDPIEKKEYDSLEELVDAASNPEGDFSAQSVWIPSALKEGVSVTGVWSQEDRYGYTVICGDRSWAFTLNPQGGSPRQAMSYLLPFGSPLNLFWADWENQSVLVTPNLYGEAAMILSLGSTSVRIQGENPAISVNPFSEGSEETLQNALFCWLDWFEFVATE